LLFKHRAQTVVRVLITDNSYCYSSMLRFVADWSYFSLPFLILRRSTRQRKWCRSSFWNDGRHHLRCRMLLRHEEKEHFPHACVILAERPGPLAWLRGKRALLSRRPACVEHTVRSLITLYPPVECDYCSAASSGGARPPNCV